MWRKIRLAILLYILVVVAATTYSNRARLADWNSELWVIIYPINGDNTEVSAAYIESLRVDQFDALETFVKNQGARYGLPNENPIKVRLSEKVASVPPPPPANPNGLTVALWSLQLRYWAWRNDNFKGPGDVKLFMIYNDPDTTKAVPHSLGLQKGMIGVVHGFARKDYRGRNQVVLIHELLHTLGASDKYDPTTSLSIFPDGYAHPDREPRFPQSTAEIMAGRIPISASEERMPDKLTHTLIGPKTAAEIGWGQ